MRRFALTVLLLASALAPAAVPAHALGDDVRTIEFRGERVSVPAGWPVIRLAEHPRTCVRLDRKAVYLGAPRASQRCPANAIGRRRAILVDPGADARAARVSAQASRIPLARISAASEYTGLGFDACTAPSSRSMRAWASSPYRAIGVYIGGLNRACSQPSLTASWVREQIAAGWHLIPTYVGLQAPTSSCTSCAKLSSSSAALQGAAAADDAVADARAIGLGPGSPIYNDMESYTRTTSATSATLAFLAAWTNRLHALGYDSGVYSSSASGIRDLASRLGSPYPQPDDIWTANWNGQRNTADPYVPAGAWSLHQRIHQYRGGHDESWGGVTINIDNNYVEGATAGSSTGSPDDPQGSLELVEAPQPGQVRISGWAYDPNAPRRAVAIRAQIGAGTKGRGGGRYELGPVAAQQRVDLSFSDPRVAAPGFDSTFTVVGSGRQKVCAYALNVGRGADRLLGCRSVGVRVPLSLTGLRAGRKAAWLQLGCLWPSGTQCPGQVMVRAKIRERLAVGRGGRAVRVRVVRRPIAQRSFHLLGGESEVLRVPFTRLGRELAREHPGHVTKLVVAIPGSRAVRTVRLP